MVPVLATGWADVRKRVQLQENVASVHQMRIQVSPNVGQFGRDSYLWILADETSNGLTPLQEITQALSHLSQQTSLSSSIRLAALQNHLAQLMHRLIHLAALTPRFIPILQSTAFRTEEAEVKAQLEGVKSDLDGKLKSKGSVGLGTPRRGGKGRMLGQVNELWGQVEEIRRGHRTRGGDGREGWLGDEKALAEVAEVGSFSKSSRPCCGRQDEFS